MLKSFFKILAYYLFRPFKLKIHVLQPDLDGVLLMLSIINEDLVIIKDACKDKNSVLKNMVDLLYKQERIINRNKFYKEILKREKIQSTGIGENIGMPHAKSDTVRLLSVVIMICKKGVNFKSLDKKPAKIIFMVASPTGFTKAYLQIIAKIARLLKNAIWRHKFLNAESNEKVINLIRDFDKSYPDRLKLKLNDNDKKKLLLKN